MHKAWLYKRKNRPGWYVMWWVDGRHHSQQCPSKGVAERLRSEVEHRLNADLFLEPLSRPWDPMVDEYLDYLAGVKRVKPRTLISYQQVLKTLRDLCGPTESTSFSVATVHDYLAQRTKAGTSPATINKDLRTLETFVHWAIEQHYMGAEAQRISWSRLKQKQTKKVVRSITVDEWTGLLKAALELYGLPWYIRIIIAVTTGLRRDDIEALTIQDLDFHRRVVRTFNSKSMKEGIKTLHDAAVPELKRYIASLPPDQTRLFVDKWGDGKWGRIKARAGIQNLRYHDLRASTASFQIQAGISTAVAQKQLDHSSPDLTTRIYANVDPVARQAVNAIPLSEVLARLSEKESPPEASAASG